MHILILEASLTGHHANYLEHIAEALLRHGHRLTITVHEEHVGNPTLLQLEKNSPGQLAIKALPSSSLLLRTTERLGVIGSEVRHWLTFRRFFKYLNTEDQVDHVFLPYLDYCLHATALLGPPTGQTKWAGICMRPSFHYGDAGVIAPKPKWSSIKERLFYKLLRQNSLQKLLTIDEILEQQARNKEPTLAGKLEFVPDPAELTNQFDRTSARRRFGIHDEEFVILVYGAIDGRKGLEYLLNGVHEKSFSRNVRILVLGRQTVAIKQQLTHKPMVISVDQYVDKVTEEAGFRAADAIWMGYSAHYVMSGVLVLAAFANKPVIATQNGLIGWMTRHHDLGLVIDCADPEQVTKAIRDLINTPARQPTEGMLTVQRRHTWSGFDKKILNSIALRP